MTKAGLLGRVAAAMAGTPIIAHTEHGLSWHHSDRDAVRLLYDLLQRRAARVTDLLFVVCERDRVAAVGNMGLPAERTLVARQGVSVTVPDQSARVAARRRLGLPGGALVYGFVGRLEKVKRVEDLVTASAQIRDRHPSAICVVVGAGPEWQPLMGMATKLGILDANFIMIDECDDVLNILPAFDVLVNPSVAEGLPMIIMEALAANLAVVATDVGGTSELIIDGVTGRLVRAGDPQTLANVICEVLSDRCSRDRYGRAGRALVSREYNATTNSKWIEDRYTEALRLRGRSDVSKLIQLRPHGRSRDATPSGAV